MTKPAKNTIKFCGILLVISVCLLLPAIARAATLYFSPSSGTHTVGSTFAARVSVSSPNQAMNAVGGAVFFPTNQLEIVSISKVGSIISLWAQEPSFSNAAGTVNFDGIALNGWSGQAGNILTITFRAKTVGAANLNFSSGMILAHDGQGTNILTSLGTANFQLGVVEPSAPEAITPSETIGAPAAPQISSPTHPDPNKWYALKDATFTWPVPSGVTGARLLFGRIPTAVPTVNYIPAISSRELENLADGIWYFSVQLRNNAGWGAISRFRFQIDTKKPSRFEIIEARREDPTEPRATFIFDARDETSDINHYEIQIGNENAKIWQDDGSHTYKTPVLGSGKYTLIAKAVDKAGNSLANSTDFIIKALEAPIITDYPKELQSGKTLTIRGKTKYPGAQINLWLKHEKDESKTYSVKSDQDGKFIFVADSGLSSGVYIAWAEVVDTRGAKSESSEKITISVGQPVFIEIGSQAVGFLGVIIPLVVLIFTLLFIIWYGWHKFGSSRKIIHKETKEAELALHQAFKDLKEEIEEQVVKLDGKSDLSEREKKICDELKKALKISEKFIGKEIEDIGKGKK